MKLMFFLAAWKRPDITEICFMSINRLRSLGVHEIDCVAVISEASMIEICERHGIKWCMHENLPLGRKKNYGLTHAMRFDFDHLIEIGSDDVLKNDFLTVYDPWWGKRDILGMTQFVMMNSENGECRLWNHSNGTFGAGRSISRVALESCKELDGYKLWSDGINRGLDNDSTFRLAEKGFLEKRVKTDIPLLIDIKSSENINRYDFTPGGTTYEYAKAISGLSYEEVCALKDLRVYATV